MLYQVSKEIRFCYGHRLLNYDGACRYLHGHNGRTLIVMEGRDLDRRGMVVDFTDIKQVMTGWVDANLDHRMLLHRDDPVLPILRNLGEPVYVMDCNPTAEAIAKLIFDAATAKGFPAVEVRFWETNTSLATYRPHD